MARIVVIGAGMGGLAAAARLATVGHRVTVCEADATHGGMVGQYQREGFRFDTGPTLLTLPAVYRDLMLKTGRTRLEDEVELRSVEPAGVHRLPDGTSVELANASRARVIQSLDDALGDGAGLRWGEMLERGRAVWEATRRPLLEEPLPDDPSALHQDPYPWPPARRGLFARRPRPPQGLADVAERELRHPGLTALLDGYALRFGFDPRVAPASLTAIPYMEQSFGVWYVTGGMRALADAVLRRCEQRRVELRFGARVQQLLGSDRVEGVLLEDGSKLDADVVVADSAPGALGLPTGNTTGNTAAVGAAPGRFTVLLALRGARPADAAHRTVVHAADRLDELDALFSQTPRLCERPTVQVLRPDDATLAPAGHEAAVLTVTVPAQGRLDWNTAGRAEAYADAVLAHAAPELRERLLWREVRTPADTEALTGATGGSVPGPALAGADGAWLHARNRTARPGLYLVGGAAHPGGGLARVGMSAAVTAEQIGTP